MRISAAHEALVSGSVFMSERASSADIISASAAWMPQLHTRHLAR
jgi:hypothetical protein